MNSAIATTGNNKLAEKGITGNLYARALCAPALAEMAPRDAKGAIIDMLTRCYFELNQNPPGETREQMNKYLALFANSVLEEVKATFKSCTMEELKLLLSQGIRKEYGEYFGLSIVTVNGWLKAYQANTARLAAKKEMAPLDEVPKFTREQAYQMWRETTLNQFDEFKATGVLKVELSARLYETFEQMGFIGLSLAEKNAIWKQAVKEVAEQMKKKRVTAKGSQRRTITGIITRLEKNTATAADQTLVRAHAKLIALKNYYSSINKLDI